MSGLGGRGARALRLAVLASGRGSNFEAICRAIDAGLLDARVVVLISDRADAAALDKARARGIAARFLDPAAFSSREDYERALADCCEQAGADLVVLAGFMRLLGKTFLSRFPLRTVNIHPALLPSFPGLHAQRQAIEYGVRFSGCTVHFVDEGVDTGPIIAQAVVPVYPEDDEDSLAARILEQEHRLYPHALQLIAAGRVEVEGRRVKVRGEKGDEE
ncbi:MAG: phosphoribosylglycinamide formyltransferase [Syntrophomonadaceae bacterium]|nr:phosphoribosylglycinamide formyltransferase [Syntrophomonadaceae bacterium]MDH7497507.1 phosphoribosylglycinamide formyltransferase [Syntrophomonadaceae bacterium]